MRLSALSLLILKQSLKCFKMDYWIQSPQPNIYLLKTEVTFSRLVRNRSLCRSNTKRIQLPLIQILPPVNVFSFKELCKHVVKDRFRAEWSRDLCNSFRSIPCGLVHHIDQTISTRFKKDEFVGKEKWQEEGEDLIKGYWSKLLDFSVGLPLPAPLYKLQASADAYTAPSQDESL